MIEEVSRLHDEGVPWGRLESFGLEYRFIARCLQKKITREEMAAGLETAIGQFAKRQMTWFRRMEKRAFRLSGFPAAIIPLRGRVLDALQRYSP